MGKTIEEARADSGVTVAQFQVVEGQEVDSTLPKGQIVNQDPQSGRNAAAGTTITVDISNGSGSTDVEENRMPNLVNQDKRLAINTLRELGFTEEAGNLVIREETSEDVTKDYVISTDPGGGDRSGRCGEGHSCSQQRCQDGNLCYYPVPRHDRAGGPR